MPGNVVPARRASVLATRARYRFTSPPDSNASLEVMRSAVLTNRERTLAMRYRTAWALCGAWPRTNTRVASRM